MAQKEFVVQDQDKLEFNPERDGLLCRFYENEYPEIDEVIMVMVTEVNDACAYVTLLEYKRKFWTNKATRDKKWDDPAETEEGDISALYEEGREPMQGMILLSELSRRRIRSIHKLIKVGRTEIVKVISVDPETGNVNLSKRQVEPEDAVKCEERFNKAKAVHSAFCYVAAEKGKHLTDTLAKRQILEELYGAVGWPLYRKYKHAYDAFKLALSPESEEDIFEGLTVSENDKTAIISYVSRKMQSQPIRIRADFELTCFTYEGIEAIKEALSVGLRTEEPQIKIKLIASPLYVMTCVTTDKQSGIDLLSKLMEEITAVIVAKGGELVVKLAPKAVSINESEQAMMDRLAAEKEAEEGDEDD